MNARRIDLVEGLGFSGAAIFVACLYLSPAHLLPAIAFLRPAMLGATMMLAAIIVRRVMRGEPVRLAGGPGAAMAVLFSLVGLSWLWAIDGTVAFGFAVGSSKLLLAFVGLVGTLRSPHHVRVAMAVAALASLVPTTQTLDRYNAGIGLVEGYRGAWIGLLANPNELAMVMAVTVPWSLHLVQTSTGVKRLAFLGAAGFQVATVVVTHSRGGALGLAVAMVATALLSSRKLRALGLVVAASIAVGLFAPQTFWQRTQTISTYERDASARGRLRAWDTGFNALADSPLLGVGGGNYVEAWDRYQPRNVRERAYASHNMWMQVFVELGALGLGVFVTMLALLAWGLWQARGLAEGGGEARALLASLAALCVCGTTGGYAFNWFFYMVLGLAGAVIASARLARARERVNAAKLAVA